MVSYEVDNSTWQFLYPTVTVTQTVVPSAWGYARMSTRYVYTVRSILIADDAADLEQKKRDAHDILLGIGGTFKWEVDSTTIIEWGRNKDANFGPHPSHLSFEKFFSVNSAIITWQLEVEVASVDSEVLDLVYTIAHTVDRNFYTHRVTTGVLRLNGAKFDPTIFVSADAYRETIEDYVCSCPPGWQRTNQNFQLSNDGLSLAFSIDDEQRYAVLPPNCTDGEAYLSTSADPKLGGKKDFVLDGYFESTADEPRAAQAAFVELASSLFSFIATNEQFVVKQLSMRKHIYRNRFEFTMAWDAWSPDWSALPEGVAAMKTSNWMLGLLTRADDWVQGYKNEIATSRGVYGTSEVLGWCGTKVVAPVIAPGGHLSDRQKDGDGNASNSGTASDEYTDSPRSEESGYYFSFHQSYRYKIDHGKVVSPYADNTTDDVVQSVQKQRIYIMVSGCAISHNKPSKIPPPPYKAEDAYTLVSDWTIHAPEHGPKWKLEWKYIQKLKDGDFPEDLKHPYSPLVFGDETTGQDDSGISDTDPWPAQTDKFKPPTYP